MLLQEATGRANVAEAIEWIASGYPIEAAIDHHALLVAVSKVDPKTPSYERALQRLTRELTRSDLDSAAILLAAEQIAPAARFRGCLDRVAKRCPSKGLDTINEAAVVAAQREDHFTIQALCAVAGLSYSELRDRGSDFPSSAETSWAPSKVKAAFHILDEVVRSDGVSSFPGARATGPLDLMPGVVGKPTSAWATVEEYRKNGVSYEVLLAQRTAGGTWLAHRNQTSNLVNHAIAGEVEELLEAHGLSVLRSTAVGGETALKRMQELAECDRRVGIVVLKGSKARYGIVFATARDQGSARSSGARLQTMARPDRLPFALVLTGRGWSSRNETADLARSFQGRLFTELTLEMLVQDVLAATK